MQIQILLFAGTLFICRNIENAAGFKPDYKKWKHAFSNMPLYLPTCRDSSYYTLLFLLPLCLRVYKPFQG